MLLQATKYQKTSIMPNSIEVIERRRENLLTLILVMLARKTTCRKNQKVKYFITPQLTLKKNLRDRISMLHQINSLTEAI